MSDGEQASVRPNWQPRARRHPRLSQKRAERRSLITHLALAALGGRGEAIAFLSTGNPSLGGRPLDLAMENAAGYRVVEAAILLLARSAVGRLQ